MINHFQQQFRVFAGSLSSEFDLKSTVSGVGKIKYMQSTRHLPLRGKFMIPVIYTPRKPE